MLVLLRHRWGKLFSSEPDVISLVATVLPLVAAFQLTDGERRIWLEETLVTLLQSVDRWPIVTRSPAGLSGATGGLLRGAGRAPLGAIINLTSYYVISIPLGLFLTFRGPKLGLRGVSIAALGVQS